MCASTPATKYPGTGVFLPRSQCEEVERRSASFSSCRSPTRIYRDADQHRPSTDGGRRSFDVSSRAAYRSYSSPQIHHLPGQNNSITQQMLINSPFSTHPAAGDTDECITASTWLQPASQQQPARQPVIKAAAQRSSTCSGYWDDACSSPNLSCSPAQLFRASSQAAPTPQPYHSPRARQYVFASDSCGGMYNQGGYQTSSGASSPLFRPPAAAAGYGYQGGGCSQQPTPGGSLSSSPYSMAGSNMVDLQKQLVHLQLCRSTSGTGSDVEGCQVQPQLPQLAPAPAYSSPTPIAAHASQHQWQQQQPLVPLFSSSNITSSPQMTVQQQQQQQQQHMDELEALQLVEAELQNLQILQLSRQTHAANTAAAAAGMSAGYGSAAAAAADLAAATQEESIRHTVAANAALRFAAAGVAAEPAATTVPAATGSGCSDLGALPPSFHLHQQHQLAHQLYMSTAALTQRPTAVAGLQNSSSMASEAAQLKLQELLLIQQWQLDVQQELLSLLPCSSSM